MYDKNSGSLDYFQLGLACADMCSHLEWDISGAEPDNLCWQSRKAIGGLTVWVKLVLHDFGSLLTVLLILVSWRSSGRGSPNPC